LNTGPQCTLNQHNPTEPTNDTLELPVQVNGKVRDRNTVSGDADDERIKQVALASTRVQALLNGTHPTRVVVVPGQIVNIVVQP
jgi:leucyl-tRNA synthetase